MNSRFNFKTERGLWNIFYFAMVWSFLLTLPVIIFVSLVAEVVMLASVFTSAILVFITMYTLRKLKFPRSVVVPPENVVPVLMGVAILVAVISFCCIFISAVISNILLIFVCIVCLVASLTLIFILFILIDRDRPVYR